MRVSSLTPWVMQMSYGVHFPPLHPFVLSPLSIPYHSPTPEDSLHLYQYLRPYIYIRPRGIKGLVFVPLITIVCYQVIIPRGMSPKPSPAPISICESLAANISVAVVINRPPDNNPRHYQPDMTYNLLRRYYSRYIQTCRHRLLHFDSTLV